MATLVTSEHTRKHRVWTIQVLIINSYFLDFEKDKIHKKSLDWCKSELSEKHLTSFPLPDVVQRLYLYRHQLEIQPDYVI